MDLPNDAATTLLLVRRASGKPDSGAKVCIGLVSGLPGRTWLIPKVANPKPQDSVHASRE